MAMIPSAWILISPTRYESEILCELDGLIKIVRVLISIDTIQNGFPDFRPLLPRFAIYIVGCNIAKFEVDSVPDYISEVFRHICIQVDGGVHLRHIVDGRGQLLFRTGNDDQLSHAGIQVGINQSPSQSQNQSQTPASRTSFQQAANAILQTISSPQPQGNDRNQWQRLVADLGSSLIGLSQQSSPIQQSTMQSSSSGATQSQPYPIRPNTQELFQRDVLGFIGQLGQMAGTVLRRNEVSARESPFERATRVIQSAHPATTLESMGTMRSLTQPATQPVPAPVPTSVTPIVDLDSPYLQRFIENRHGAHREIIPIVETGDSVSISGGVGVGDTHVHASVPGLDSAPPIPMSAAAATPNPIPASIPIVDVAGLQRISALSRSTIHNSEAKFKTTISATTLAKLATFVNQKILAGKTKPPNFAKPARTNLRKIKNYIHHHTKVWLSKNEIEIFIDELKKINPTLVVQDIDIQLD